MRDVGEGGEGRREVRGDKGVWEEIEKKMDTKERKERHVKELNGREVKRRKEEKGGEMRGEEEIEGKLNGNKPGEKCKRKEEKRGEREGRRSIRRNEGKKIKTKKGKRWNIQAYDEGKERNGIVKV